MPRWKRDSLGERATGLVGRGEGGRGGGRRGGMGGGDFGRTRRTNELYIILYIVKFNESLSDQCRPETSEKDYTLF
jgi:hypothetical protein